MNFISISADSGLAWMSDIKNNISPIGDAQINELLSKYYLKKTKYYATGLTHYHTAFFNSDSNYNILPLTKLFEEHPDVIYSDPNSAGLDGSDILDSVGQNFIELYYVYKWGDCFVGCLHSHWWVFRVYNDCSVEYRGNFGESLPADVGLYETVNEVAFNIYPNPFKNKLYIDFTKSEGIYFRLTMINTLGQAVISEKQINSVEEINIETFTSGIYYLILSHKDGEKKVYKVVKE